MINNISIFCNISLSKCHKLVNIDSSNGLVASHNKPFHSIVLQKWIIRMITKRSHRAYVSEIGIIEICLYQQRKLQRSETHKTCDESHGENCGWDDPGDDSH